jgi:hypothetical protein
VGNNLFTTTHRASLLAINLIHLFLIILLVNVALHEANEAKHDEAVVREYDAGSFE